MAYQLTFRPTEDHPPVPCEVPLFGPEDLISSYSRAQAIEDGVLRDVSEVAREAGIRYPVALTAGAWADCVTWTREDYPQDEAGRLWDVVYLLRLAIGRSQGTDRIAFGVLRVPNEGRKRRPRWQDLVAQCGPGDAGEPVITVMLPGED